jgi:glycerol-3-phosphate dehydrogenase
MSRKIKYYIESNKLDTDVIIIGGGICGCALAYFLALVGPTLSLMHESIQLWKKLKSY